MTVFEQAFRIVIGEEGGFSDNPADPGNWTGGGRNRGTCRGTNFGIAASAHPDLDIAGLTLSDAHAIYLSSYWTPLGADQLPPPLALLVFDAAVNCGIGRAVRWLQAAAGAKVDSNLGPATLAAVADHANDGATLCTEFQAQRLTWMTRLPTWHAFGLGWSRRLCRLPYQSLKMETS